MKGVRAGLGEAFFIAKPQRKAPNPAAGAIVGPGGPLGVDHHIRAAVRDQRASSRLLRAIENAL